MEQLYIEALLIHWHTGLKFSSENRNPQIPEIGRKNRSIHPFLSHLLIAGCDIGVQLSVRPSANVCQQSMLSKILKCVSLAMVLVAPRMALGFFLGRASFQTEQLRINLIMYMQKKSVVCSPKCTEIDKEIRLILKCIFKSYLHLRNDKKPINLVGSGHFGSVLVI